jgi:predicted RNA binding protein YcfA (HicA-like mRNA interferase family)
MPAHAGMRVERVTTKLREAIRLVQQGGCRLSGRRVATGSSSMLLKKGTVTIAGYANDDLPPKTWASIRRQAGIQELLCLARSG